ncbi:MAG TPA: lysophospholipid acyltransferase family protein [Steroidobacteraceae bacterium]|jgi:KDO2-lipid IV(A) lauroyltransferase|nr:lysophospholipid acyltransferase family protein [Steroidobacteraceae bacterium]
MIKLLSRIPFAALYAFAGFLYFLAYYVVRHRRHVIVEQLEKVYPEASVAQRVAIHKQFLRNYCDVLIEVLKSVSMSEADMRRRMRVTNLEVARQYLDAGQSIMFVTSHLGNWEWLLHGVTLQLGYPVDAAYKPLHEAWAERLMLGVRSRFGARLVPAKELLADILRRRGITRALGVNADQAPISTDQRYWTKFLGQDTAFYIGAEQIARATRLPMMYARVRRVQRSCYEVEFLQLWDGREAIEPNQMTERYARAYEADVLASPADWLWSYRRWRLKKPLYAGD